MAELSKALVACCDCGNRRTLVDLVAQCGLTPIIRKNTADAVSVLAREHLCVVFCQDELPEDGYKTVLAAARQAGVPMVVPPRLADSQRYLESMELGAYDFICQQYIPSEVAALVTSLRTTVPPRASESGSGNVPVARSETHVLIHSRINRSLLSELCSSLIV